MITKTDSPLNLGEYCHQYSCRFDKTSYQESLQDELGIYIPEKMSRAVQKRKAEYIAGRYCVKKSLAAINITNQIVESGEDRAPVWPQGVVGSITHSSGYASAVVAKANELRAIGIDSEKCINDKTSRNISSHILTGNETFDANTHIAANEHVYLTLIFSAKESIYKCLNPLVKQFFDFKHAEISFDRESDNRFRYRLLKTLNEEFCDGYQGSGQFFIQGDFIHTATVVRHHQT